MGQLRPLGTRQHDEERRAPKFEVRITKRDSTAPIRLHQEIVTPLSTGDHPRNIAGQIKGGHRNVVGLDRPSRCESSSRVSAALPAASFLTRSVIVADGGWR